MFFLFIRSFHFFSLGYLDAMAYIARQRIYFVNLQHSSGTAAGAGTGGKNIKKTTSTGTMDEYDDNASTGGKSIASSTVGKYSTSHEIPTPKNVSTRESTARGFNETGLSRKFASSFVFSTVLNPLSIIAHIVENMKKTISEYHNQFELIMTMLKDEVSSISLFLSRLVY
jgi:hypothetical protein